MYEMQYPYLSSLNLGLCFEESRYIRINFGHIFQGLNFDWLSGKSYAKIRDEEEAAGYAYPARPRANAKKNEWTTTGATAL